MCQSGVTCLLADYCFSELAQKNTLTYDIGNPDPGLGQAQKCGGVKSVNISDIFYRTFFY